jgi:hypothetical protein
MTDPDRELELALELSRLVAEPGSGDGARVLMGVRAKLGVLPAATRAAATTKAAGAALHQLVAVGVVTATLGFLAGWGLHRAYDPAIERGELPPPAVAVAVPLPSAAPSAAAEAARSAEAAPAPAAAAATAAVAAADQAAAATPARRRSAQEQNARRRATPPPSPRDAAFFEAVDLLRRAQRAVNKHDGQVALSLLDELDTRFERALLGEERQATRALALCESDEVERAREVSAALQRTSPSSIYAGRLRLSCAGWQSTGPDRRPNEPGLE